MAQVVPRAPKITRSQTKIPNRVPPPTSTLNPKSTLLPDESEHGATVQYIARILGARPRSSISSPQSTHDSLQPLLPPLTSSNEIDVQLYALIAVILDQFVQKWYAKITNDEAFVSQIVQIIAHCTRAFEQRLRDTNLESLLLDEIPALLLDHLEVIDIAQTPWQGREPPSDPEFEARYHALRPHVALDPIPIDAESARLQQENEGAWCVLLVKRLLPLLLPPEDLQNPCLHVLVSEIFSEMIVRNGICGKACQPWLWWDGVTKVLNSLPSRPGAPAPAPVPALPVDRLKQYGLMSESQPATDSRQDSHKTPASRRKRYDAIMILFWSSLQIISTTWLLLRALSTALMQASSIPARATRQVASPDPARALTTDIGDAIVTNPAHLSATKLPTHDDEIPKPIVSMKLWLCLSHILHLPTRMPWVVGGLALLQHAALYGPGRVAGLDSRLDRLASSSFRARLNSCPTWGPGLLRAVRTALFPGNALAPGRPTPPTDAEVAVIRRDCAVAIVDAVPSALRPRVFSAAAVVTDRAAMLADCDRLLLAACRSPVVNRHLVVRAVDLIAVRLFPEIARRED